MSIATVSAAESSAAERQVRGPADVEIDHDLLERMRARAEEAYPEECCGFLTGTRSTSAATDRAATDRTDRTDRDKAGTTLRVHEAIPTPNAAPEDDRTRKFVIEPKALLEMMRKYRDRKEDLVGFYHSHPNHAAELSPTDLKFARHWPRTMWLIVPVDEKQAAHAGKERAWWLPARNPPASGETMPGDTAAGEAGIQDLGIRELKIRETRVRETASGASAPALTSRGGGE